MNVSNRPFAYAWLTVLALIFYLFTAYKSSGYNNADEHYQIVEFANYKLGIAQKKDLAWEFHDRIRPSLQPAFCYVIFKAANYLGVVSPYMLTFILRAITALSSVIIIKYFTRSCRHLIEQRNYLPYLLFSFFVWFLPYINVRFSSETWSGLFILLALALVMKQNFAKNLKTIILSGFVLGIAILFRYQSAIIAGGLIFWLMFVKRMKMSFVLTLALAIVLVLLAGVMLDRWFYGEYCFTLYNYFYVNIVNDVASQYGISPWYSIILYIIKSPGPLGILIFLSYIALAIKYPQHILIWVTLPYLVIHSVIPHKELRFLFPLANLIPLVILLAFQSLKLKLFFKLKIVQLALVLLILVNVAGMLALSLRGAGLARISASEYIHNHYSGRDVQVIYIGSSNPYWDWAIPKNTFYYNKKVSLKGIESIWKNDLKTELVSGKTNLLILSPEDITGPRAMQMFKNVGLRKVFQSIPEYALFINQLYDEDINRSSLLIYEFSR